MRTAVWALTIVASCFVLGACSSTPRASLSATSSPTPATSIPSATATAKVTTSPAAGDFIYWALDRGPELTPDQDRLRVYVFGLSDTRGAARLLAPDGSVAGTAGIMGSGIFSADSCVSRVSSKENGVITIGAVQMTDAAQAAFLAAPAAYRAEIDRSVINPGASVVVVRLVDSGCRPR